MSLPESWTQLSQKSNQRTIALKTIAWDGEKIEDIVVLPPASGPVLIAIDNTEQEEALTIKLEQKVRVEGETEIYFPQYDADGQELELAVTGGQRRIFGTFSYFPRFLGGKIILTAAEAPADKTATIVQVQEIGRG